MTECGADDSSGNGVKYVLHHVRCVGLPTLHRRQSRSSNLTGQDRAGQDRTAGSFFSFFVLRSSEKQHSTGSSSSSSLNYRRGVQGCCGIFVREEPAL